MRWRHRRLAPRFDVENLLLQRRKPGILQNPPRIQFDHRQYANYFQADSSGRKFSVFRLFRDPENETTDEVQQLREAHLRLGAAFERSPRLESCWLETG